MIETDSGFAVVTNNEASRLVNSRGESLLHKKVLDPLTDSGANLREVLERPTADDLAASIKPDDVVVVCGGDGTINWVLNALIERDLAHDVTLLPLPWGGANDAARSLYGHKTLPEILGNSTPAKAYPIEARLSRGTEARTLFGLGYVSLGATARGAAKMNGLREKGVARHQRYYRALSGAATSPGLKFEDTGFHSSFDITAQNGRMSQVLKPFNYHFFEEAFQLTVNQNLASFIGRGALWMARQEKGSIITDQQTADFVLQTDTYIQTDGEDYRVFAGDEVSIANGGMIRLVRLKR